MNTVNIHVISQHNVNYACGTKAIALAELLNLGISVPPFYVISSTSFDDFITERGIISPEAFFSTIEYDSRHLLQFEQVFLVSTSGEPVLDDKYMVRSSSVPLEKIDTGMFPSMISGVFESYYAGSALEAKQEIIEVWKSVYSKKAYNQCRFMSEQAFVKSIAVIIQKYINSVVSGVAHTNQKGVSINWVEGHLLKIVNGETLGNNIDAYISETGDSILRGIEAEILKVNNSPLCKAIPLLLKQAQTIRGYYGCEQEIEWIYDANAVWVVQTQPLLLE